MWHRNGARTESHCAPWPIQTRSTLECNHFSAHAILPWVGPLQIAAAHGLLLAVVVAASWNTAKQPSPHVHLADKVKVVEVGATVRALT